MIYNIDEIIIRAGSITTSEQGGGLRYGPILVHALHTDSARTTSIQEGGWFRYSFWTISVHNEKWLQKGPK